VALLTIEAHHPVMVNRVIFTASDEVGIKLNDFFKFQTLHRIDFIYDFVLSQRLTLHEATLNDFDLVQVWMRYSTYLLVKLLIQKPKPNFECLSFIHAIFITRQTVISPQQHRRVEYLAGLNDLVTQAPNVISHVSRMLHKVDKLNTWLPHPGALIKERL